MLRIRPACERYGIRPVIYLPTAFIGTRRRFWWDRVAMCLKLTEARSFLAPLDPEQELPLGTPEEREAATELLLPHTEHLAPAAQEELCAELERRLALPSTAEAEEPVVLSWDEVRELRSCYDFGAHTVSHAKISSLDSVELRRELGESKAELERQLGEPCETLAVPYGGAVDYTPEAVQVADEAGFRVIFSMEDSLRRPARTGRCWLVDRLTMTWVQDAAGLAAKVTWPRIFVPKWTQIVRSRLAPALRALNLGADA